MRNDIYKINSNWRIKLKKKNYLEDQKSIMKTAAILKEIRRRGTDIKLCIYYQFQLEDQITEIKTSGPE